MTRETTAAVMAVGTGMLILSAVTLFALLNQPAPSATARTLPPVPPGVVPGTAERPEEPSDPMVARGQQVYQAQRCFGCHAIAGQGSPRYPLDGVGSRLTPEELRLWVVAPQQIRPGVRKPAFDDLPEDDVVALVRFMETLTRPEG